MAYVLILPIIIGKKVKMVDNYRYGFNIGDVIDNIDAINSEIAEMYEEGNKEIDRKKEFNLVYRQFIEGLKLSTGVKLYF